MGRQAQIMLKLVSTMDQIWMGRMSANGSSEAVKMCRNVRRATAAAILSTPRPKITMSDSFSCQGRAMDVAIL